MFFCLDISISLNTSTKERKSQDSIKPFNELTHIFEIRLYILAG
jgi:hypothetical protein